MGTHVVVALIQQTRLFVGNSFDFARSVGNMISTRFEIRQGQRYGCAAALLRHLKRVVV